MQKKISIFSFFAGIGILDLAFEKAVIILYSLMNMMTFSWPHISMHEHK